MTVRTRFAPSPTGYLHIGGVRTALFNWLFARKHGGQFLLRIDDTDQQRNVEEALAPILHGFRWLGIDWDEGPEVGGPHAPYFQSQRGERYQLAVKRLLDAGAAYYDYARTEELQQEREAAEKEKKSYLYSRRWMAETAEDRQRFEAEGRQAVVRLKMPREGKLVLPDLIRGDVEFEWASEQDHVIQRADGTCLYHLANVVDDFDFAITHVIRAEEHLSNTPRQVFIVDALGYPRPQYAHLPYVAEPGSKNKLSKRKLDKYLKNRDFAAVNEHGAAIARRLGLTTFAETFNPVIVDFYEQVGYLPDAIINYLLLLGWSLDGTSEFFTRDAMIANFSLERVNRAPASFDPQKLMAFQSHYMNQVPPQQKAQMVLPYLQQAGLVGAPPAGDVNPLPVNWKYLELAGFIDHLPEGAVSKLEQIIVAAGDRIKVAGDILEFDDFFTADDQLVYDEKAFDKRIRQTPEAAELLQKFSAELAVAEPFTAENLDRVLHTFVEREGIKIAQLIHPLRLALTGKAVGFGLFETLAILGRESSLKRIERALQLV